MHQVTLLFEDGKVIRIGAQEKETLYAAALRQKVRLETDCLQGVCATCKALCTVGDYSIRDYSEEALSADDFKNRYILACQTVVHGDCVVEFPYGSVRVLEERARADRECRVSAVRNVSPSVVRLDLALESEEPLSFLPGQYAHLSIPEKGLTRAYSFANCPSSMGPNLSFYIRLLPDGRMSQHLAHTTRPGDSVVVTGPFGRFYLRSTVRPILMIAGGTGVAPLLSMLTQLHAQGDCQYPIHLIYGVGNSDDLIAAADFEQIALGDLDFTYECIAVERGNQWRGATGSVIDLLHPDAIHHGNCDAYLCGPPGMIDAANRWLLGVGLSPALIHMEKFIPT